MYYTYTRGAWDRNRQTQAKEQTRGNMTGTTSKRYRAPEVRVQVTAPVIEQSRHRDSAHCMVAEAVKVAFPGAQRVSVDVQTIRFTDPKRNLRYVYLTPRVAQEAIIYFDQGELPEEFGFLLKRGQVVLANKKRDQGKMPQETRDKIKASEGWKRGSQKMAEMRGPGEAETDAEVLTEAEGKDEPKTKAGKQAKSALSQATLLPEGHGHVPTRTGGTAPPLVKDKNKVPFSRRRQFGLRAFDRQQ